MNRGAWWTTVHGVATQLDTTQQLNNNNLDNSIRCTFLEFFADAKTPIKWKELTI